MAFRMITLNEVIIPTCILSITKLFVNCEGLEAMGCGALDAWKPWANYKYILSKVPW
mgnify:CR=1 FL=1